MCKHFLSLCIFHVCHLSQWPKQVTWSSAESMSRAHENFEYITATIYHPGFAKPVTVRIQARRDMKEGISSGVALHIHLTWEQLDILIVWFWSQMVPESDMTHQGQHTPKLSPSHSHAQPLNLKEALVRDSILVAGEGWAKKWLVYFYLPSLCP